jgi:hypothetical protein
VSAQIDDLILLPTGEPVRIIAETPVGASWIVINSAGKRFLVSKERV